MAADDFQNYPSDQALPSELDTSSAYSGNRPASGARRVTPGEVLSQGFQGAENAGDFLGLDVEFTASQDPFSQAGPLDLQPPPTTTYIDPGEEAAGFAPAPQPAGDPVQEFAEAPSAFEFGEDLGTEDGGPAFDEPSPTASRKPLLVGALLVAALGVGGYFYGPELYSRFGGGASQVAVAPVDSTPKPKAPVAKSPLETGKPAGDGAVATVDPIAAPKTSDPVSKPQAAIPGSGEVRTTPRPSDDAKIAAVTPTAKGGDSATPDLLTDLLSTPDTTLSGKTQGFPDLQGSAYDWASPDRLELIWRGTEVPLEAVTAPAKTVMPRVGNVRVFMNSGDVFEGHLYAVGQNRVWIDTAPGRVGLDGERVERILVLPPDPAGANGQQTTAGVGLAAGGKRVRVRVPGGMLYGRVLKQNGEDVTLVLDDGSGKVHVKASELEELGSGRAVVVSR